MTNHRWQHDRVSQVERCVERCLAGERIEKTGSQQFLIA
jgi:hypothetical protein